MFEGRTAINRENKRKSLFYKFEVLNTDNKIIGCLGDLTLNGLKIICDNPISTKQKLALKIKVPARINNNEQIILQTESMWCRNQVESDNYHVGLKILYLDEQDKNTVKIIMDLLSSPDDMIL